MNDPQTTSFYPQTGAIYKADNGEEYRVELLAYVEGGLGKQVVVYTNVNGETPYFACPVAMFGEEFKYVRNV